MKDFFLCYHCKKFQYFLCCSKKSLSYFKNIFFYNLTELNLQCLSFCIKAFSSWKFGGVFSEIRDNNQFFWISATLNPFEAPATSNPFAAQMSNQPARMTLSQLQSNTQQGFSQSASSGLLPAPLAPLNTTGPAQPQQQSYNPFLWKYEKYRNSENLYRYIYILENGKRKKERKLFENECLLNV